MSSPRHEARVEPIPSVKDLASSGKLRLQFSTILFLGRKSSDVQLRQDHDLNFSRRGASMLEIQ